MSLKTAFEKICSELDLTDILRMTVFSQGTAKLTSYNI